MAECLEALQVSKKLATGSAFGSASNCVWHGEDNGHRREKGNFRYLRLLLIRSSPLKSADSLNRHSPSDCLRSIYLRKIVNIFNTNKLKRELQLADYKN